jgi:hypothetical protein
MRVNRFSAALVFALLFFSTPCLMGQSMAGGSVVGTVSDPSGGVVPGAKVALTSVQTGTTLEATTSSAGQYVFPVVPVGTYKMTVTGSGFQQEVISDIVIPLNKTLTEDVKLRLGAASSRIEVTASAVHLEQQTSQASTTVDEHTYSVLPIALNGAARSPTMIADLMPGVADSPGVSGSAGPTGQAFSETINGGQEFGGEVMYDGAVLAQTNVAADYRVQPVPVEALQEFSLVQNNFSAEYSRTPGGVLSFNTRSGSNKFHAEMYDFMENSALDARGFFATTTPARHQNEFGVDVAGPIDIPHVYNGKDKTFFFVYYSGFRLSEGQAPALATIPTVAEQSGDFSNFKDANGNVVPIYDPLTTQCNAQGVCSRQQFSYNGVLNVIPPSRIIAAAKAFIPFIPTPINSNETNNILSGGSTTTSENRYGVKLDHYISQKYVIHGFFGQSPYNNDYPTIIYKEPFDYYGYKEPDDYMIARITQDITLAPNLLAHVTLGYNRDNFTYLGPRSFSNNTLGIGNIAAIAPALSFTNGYANAGSDSGQGVIENGSTVNGFLSWIQGKHDIKVGAEYTRQGDNTTPITAADFSFSYQETDLPNAANPAATGNGFASFLIGAVDSGHEGVYPYEVGTRFSHWGTYFQDNYKVLPNLTLNLGVRYDIPWTRTQVHGTLSSFDPSIANPGVGGRLGALAFAGSGANRIGRDRFDDVRYIYVQPRFGFAYKLGDKNVIRGGFGIFMGSSGDVLENGIRIQYSDGFNANPTFSTTNLGVTPAFYLQDGFPSFTPPPFIDPTLDNNGSINWLQPQDGTTALISNWSLDLQRALPAGFLLDVGYVANSGHHLGSNLLNVNQVNPQYLSLGNTLNAPLSSEAGQATGVPLPYAGFTGTVAQALRPYPQYQSISQDMQTAGKSHYNSLQVKLQRQFFKSLSVLTSYTYAKLMTNADSQEGWYTPGGGSQNAFNLRQEMTVGVIVPPQVLNVTYVYEFPVGKGKRFVNDSRAADAIIGGWSITGIQRYQSGNPLQIRLNNTLPLFNNNLYPNIVTGQSLRASWSGRFDPHTDVYLNANAFSVPAPFTFGDASKTLPVRGFSYFNEDISLQKRFRIKESVSFEIGADAFNIFNRTTFGAPDTSSPTTNPDFGVIGSQANAPRSVQFRARLTF